MRRVREGSEDAAWEVFKRYGGYIRRAVRRILKPQLRSKFDSVDFVQCVWLSFFRMRESAERFDRPQQLVRFLAGMAHYKVHMELRGRLSTEKHDVGREVPIDDLPDEDGPEFAAPEPEPVDAAIAREQWERLLQGQPPRYRRIIKLKLQGYTCAEIGKILHLDSHTVSRFLTKLLYATIV
jgi:RNA polymerase sigma-70 factor (ECF subfamily)